MPFTIFLYASRSKTFYTLLKKNITLKIKQIQKYYFAQTCFKQEVLVKLLVWKIKVDGGREARWHIGVSISISNDLLFQGIKKYNKRNKNCPPAFAWLMVIR